MNVMLLFGTAVLLHTKFPTYEKIDRSIELMNGKEQYELSEKLKKYTQLLFHSKNQNKTYYSSYDTKLQVII